MTEIDELIDDIEFEAECGRLEKQLHRFCEKHSLIDIQDAEPVQLSKEDKQLILENRVQTRKFLEDKYGKDVCDKLLDGLDAI